MIAIIDYGMGNIHSVAKAVQSMGAAALVTNNPDDFKLAQKFVLPGVGAFNDAMVELERRNLVSAIHDAIKNKKIFLGICLGMQLLFEKSQEAKNISGLCILKGEVKKFSAKKGIKVPQIGWNQLNITSRDCPLLKDIPDKSYVYFCHSYYPQPSEKKVNAATCNYGIDFPAVVWKDNVFGVQFHPEKSQDVGLRMLRNFVEI